MLLDFHEFPIPVRFWFTDTTVADTENWLDSAHNIIIIIIFFYPR